MAVRSIGAVVLLVAATASVLIGWREFSAAQFGLDQPLQAFQHVALVGEPPVPPSVRGQRSAALGCLAALSNDATLFQVDDDIERVAARCDALAADLLAATPSLSAAHLVQASARIRLGDAEGAVEALHLSASTGPRTQWLAARRVVLARSLPEAVIPQTQAVVETDMTLMFESRVGRQFLANLYIRDMALRETILKLAETRPDAEQQDFLLLVRQSA